MKPNVVKNSFFGFLSLVLFISSARGQDKKEILLDRVKTMHEYMVRDHFLVDLYLDDSLSYGHSNGWVENWKEFRENLGTRLIYHSITEDSVDIRIHGNYATVRFIGDFDVTLDGKRAVYKLKVLQVWVRKNKKQHWDLFARQAIKRQ